MKKIFFYLFLFLLILSSVLIISNHSSFLKSRTVFSQTNSPLISSVTDNRTNFPNNSIPKFEKFEITFQVKTNATNLQFPYDPSPPSGLQPNQGITVNALFSPDNWQTVYEQPAFYYQDFDYQVKNGQDWIYPNGQFSWKVRFSPHQEGYWQYKLTAQDIDGTTETSPQSFSVVASENKGFVRVSKTDSRYFEYDDGTYFPGLGYNMNYNQVSWDNPVSENQLNFQAMKQNGIQLIRIWLSQWGIFGSFGTAWNSISTNGQDLGIELDNNPNRVVFPGSDASLGLFWPQNTISWEGDPCFFTSWLWKSPAVKRNTSYHLKIHYRIPTDLAGPNIAGQPYGLVAKFAGWLTGQTLEPGTTWRTNQDCAYPAALINKNNNPKERVISPYVSLATSDWAYLETDFITDATAYPYGQNDFLPPIYLALENITGNINGGDGSAFINRVEIRENLPGGILGPDILAKSWISYDLYMDQVHSYAFDKALNLAKENDIYFKMAIMDKNDVILNSFDWNGLPRSWDPSNAYFYGNWGQPTRTYWLQKAWWRYLQARWGYSPNIHTWELLNEGDPFNGLHYTLANNFALFMHQFKPNDHLVTTSFWHSDPYDEFWQNSSFPNLDYVDIHCCYKKIDGTENVRIDYQKNIYYPQVFAPEDFYDTANINYKSGLLFGTKGQYGIQTKPTFRGEFGFYLDGTDSTPQDIFAQDTQAIWLHNYVWGMINSFGLYDASYWYPNTHIYNPSYNATNYDYRNQFGNFYRFIKDIPLSNGYYTDASASTTNPSLRVWGQKDLVNGNAHLWLANPNHTWKNVVDNVTIAPLSSSITLTGFTPNKSHTLEWWDTYTGQVDTTLGPNTMTTDTNGNLTFSVSNLTTDLALKIFSGNPPVTPKPGDLNNDLAVNILDLRYFLSRFLNILTIFDYNKMVENFGK